MSCRVVHKFCGCSLFTNTTCRPLTIMYTCPTRSNTTQAKRENDVISYTTASGPGSLKKETMKIKAEPPKDLKADWIGPPEPVSNIRPIKFFIPDDETPLEKKYRLQRQEVWQWNQDFWETHNKLFFEKKQEFVQTTLAKKRESQSDKSAKTLTPEELSVFYKQILNENYKDHMHYNVEWYKKNISLLWPAFLINVSKLWRRRKHVTKS